MAKNVVIITDPEDKKTVLIHDVRFKGKSKEEWKEIEKYLKERRGDSDIVFLSLKKPYKPLSDRGVRFMLNRLKERAEVSERIFPHNFRRTKATALLNSGMSLQAVQQFLGHSSPVTTEIYATISQENLKNEYKRLTE